MIRFLEFLIQKNNCVITGILFISDSLITNIFKMQIATLLAEMDAMVSKGQIVEAIDKFFASDSLTTDFDGTITKAKAETMAKLSGFVGAIQKVNGITLHHSIAGEDFSMSEFTFDFDMKDGSKILWHEIIRRKWKNGKVVNEQYFKN